MSRPRLLLVVGTRPEALKIAPVVNVLREGDACAARFAVTGQHRALLDQALAAFGIVPDIDLNVRRDDASLDGLAAALLTAIGAMLDRERPDRVVVHGDTLTTMAATLAGYWRRIPVAHVEAGLRSGDLNAPWPEEGSRRTVSTLADLHFAPTAAAAAALRRENVPAAAIHVTGNTVIDALFLMRERIAAHPALAAALDPVVARAAGKRIVTVTVHRRENWGDALARIMAAVTRIADRGDAMVVVPLHANPTLRRAVVAALGAHPGVTLVPALDYPSFVRLMIASAVIVTDSGGVQEEAPALGTPVLVLRDRTERPEGVAAGAARLVGTDADTIVAQVARLLDDPAACAAMSAARLPYGDGHAAARIAAILARADRR